MHAIFFCWRLFFYLLFTPVCSFFFSTFFFLELCIELLNVAYYHLSWRIDLYTMLAAINVNIVFMMRDIICHIELDEPFYVYPSYSFGTGAMIAPVYINKNNMILMSRNLFIYKLRVKSKCFYPKRNVEEREYMVSLRIIQKVMTYIFKFILSSYSTSRYVKYTYWLLRVEYIRSYRVGNICTTQLIFHSLFPLIFHLDIIFHQPLGLTTRYLQKVASKANCTIFLMLKDIRFSIPLYR